MIAVVTGGAGFIGSHVVDTMLASGVTVRVLDNFSTGRPENLDHVRSDIELIECDLSEKGSWVNSFEKADFVVHLAALADIVPSIQNPEAYFKSNVQATLNVLESARQNSIRKLVYSASSSCYGITDITPTPETAPICAEYPYALTKRLGEELVMHWHRVYNLPAISLRFFNVYGTRSRTSGTYGAMFGVFLAQKLANEPYTIVGDGSQTRDFTYVTDVANAVHAACYSDVSGAIFNVGSGRTVSVNEIAKKLGGQTVHIPKRPGEPDCTFADITAIQKMLHWSPSIDINRGIELVLENIEYWKDATVWTPSKIQSATEDWFKFLSK
ncbi:SDR family oxidoreductase [Alphaproteobacteria bacterium]|nr:SDR family oxidoreductase [Alphaproteobacteria bacterium]